MSWIQINVADAFFQLLFIRENYYIQMYFGEFIFLSIKKKKASWNGEHLFQSLTCQYFSSHEGIFTYKFFVKKEKTPTYVFFV